MGRTGIESKDTLEMNVEPTEPYVYQPYGALSHPEKGDKLFAVAGPGLETVRDLTKEEANAICEDLKRQISEGKIFANHSLNIVANTEKFKEALRKIAIAAERHLCSECKSKPIFKGTLCRGCYNRAITPQVRKRHKPGRNDPCPCGSGIKFKKCCIGKVIQ